MFAGQALAVAATTDVILAHGAMGPWDEVMVGVPVPVLFVVLLVIGRRSKRLVFDEDDDLEYPGVDSFQDGGGGPGDGGDAAGADTG